MPEPELLGRQRRALGATREAKGRIARRQQKQTALTNARRNDCQATAREARMRADAWLKETTKAAHVALDVLRGVALEHLLSGRSSPPAPGTRSEAAAELKRNTDLARRCASDIQRLASALQRLRQARQRALAAARAREPVQVLQGSPSQAEVQRGQNALHPLAYVALGSFFLWLLQRGFDVPVPFLDVSLRPCLYPFAFLCLSAGLYGTIRWLCQLVRRR